MAPVSRACVRFNVKTANVLVFPMQSRLVLDEHDGGSMETDGNADFLNACFWWMMEWNCNGGIGWT
jgi:hypothetical protein